MRLHIEKIDELNELLGLALAGAEHTFTSCQLSDEEIGKIFLAINNVRNQMAAELKELEALAQ